MGSPPRSLPTDSPNIRVVHGVVKNGCYLFACGEYEEQLWRSTEVRDLFPVRTYARAWKLPPPVMAHKMREWREKRGHEEAEAWFSEK